MCLASPTGAMKQRIFSAGFREMVKNDGLDTQGKV
jgi:hypothetical protein